MWGRIDSRRPRLDKQDNFDFPFGPSPQKSILLLCPIKTFWMDNNVLGNIARNTFSFLGYPRLRICLKSSATAASKTYDTSQSSCRHSYSMPVALLCCRREFLFRGHLEDSHDTSKVPSAVSIVLFASCFTNTRDLKVFSTTTGMHKNCILFHFFLPKYWRWESF